MLPSFSNLKLEKLLKGNLSIDANKKRKLDNVDAQRMQSYYVCTQDKDPVLFVVKGWFVGSNRHAFDIMQRAAGLDLALDTNDFYTLNSKNVSFDMSLGWYNDFFPKMDDYIASKDDRALLPLPATLRQFLSKPGNGGQEGFVQKFIQFFDDELIPNDAKLSKMEVYRVPAKTDSMVFFTGPHSVVKTPVTRLVIFTHSLSETTAQNILNSFEDYSEKIKAMEIPPNAQGKTRSSLVDKYLKQAHGQWGWTDLPEDLRSSLLIDKDSIDNAPLAAPANADMVLEMRSAIIADSCYVHENVLRDAAPVHGIKLSASDLEQWVLGCIATVLDRALAEQERLRTALRDWLQTYPGRIDALLAHPENPHIHEKVLKARLDAAGMLDDELREYAMNVLLRGVRQPKSKSWEQFNNSETAFRWPADPDTKKKVLRSPGEASAELDPAPDALPVADGPLARLDGDMNNKKDLWQLVHNIGGHDAAARLRLRLFKRGEIKHPHIGAWVSARKPWCPPLSTPVGCWQNVYQVLVLGMFDSHYMPRHVYLLHVVKPLIEQMWHATSRTKFTKVLFAPERFNVRELPKGGLPLQWHIDQDVLAPACPP